MQLFWLSFAIFPNGGADFDLQKPHFILSQKRCIDRSIRRILAKQMNKLALFMTLNLSAAWKMRMSFDASQSRRDSIMNGLELIITCEDCGHVEHSESFSENDSKKIYQQFSCPGHCSSKYFSYISIGEVSAESILHPMKVAQVA